VEESLGGPPDIVYECVGAQGVIAQALDHVRLRGTIIVQGA
jgi:(R,R)-butanediol dehydrogenase/meso-butanediol dehydrogenase/diacetyl reductase